jgi:hypothetical protein
MFHSVRKPQEDEIGMLFAAEYDSSNSITLQEEQ